MMDIEFSVPAYLQNHRLDVIVSQICEPCSRSQAAAWIAAGNIKVCGRLKKPGYRVRTMDQIAGKVTEKAVFRVLPEKMDLDILYEDQHLMIINKPAGRVVHPGPGNHSGTLVNALLYHDPGLVGVGDSPIRAGIVHRLDKDTSGVMVVAKTTQALGFLQKEFKNRRVDKRYLAIVAGIVSPDEGEITLAIGRHPVKRKLMSTNSHSGKSAATFWQVKKHLDGATLVEARIQTGRTHQIRVHFHAIGHPVVGDAVYQYRQFRKSRGPGVRQMLHAVSVSFRHPYSGRRVAFEAPLPADFAGVLSCHDSA